MGLRKFILKLWLFLMIWGAVPLHRHWPDYGLWAASWTVLLGAALAYPAPISPVRKGVHMLGSALGKAVTFLILAVIFFLVVTPLSWAARIFGKKFLELGWDRKAASYWRPREAGSREKAAMERQF